MDVRTTSKLLKAPGAPVTFSSGSNVLLLPAVAPAGRTGLQTRPAQSVFLAGVRGVQHSLKETALPDVFLGVHDLYCYEALPRDFANLSANDLVPLPGVSAVTGNTALLRGKPRWHPDAVLWGEKQRGESANERQRASCGRRPSRCLPSCNA
jgi:hypothetical protein